MKHAIILLILFSGSVAVGEIKLDTWQAIGPFKNAQFGSLVPSSKHIYGPEADVLAKGSDLADLSKVYAGVNLDSEGKPFPMYDAFTVAKWTEHPEWTDGYRNLLPRGPAPSRHETAYLYRTITASEPTNVILRVYAEDAIQVWLNGTASGSAMRVYSPERRPTSIVASLALQKGANRLLVKITSLFAEHGFAFALDGVTVSSKLTPDGWQDVCRNETLPPLLNAQGLPKSGVFRIDALPEPMFDPARLAMEEDRKSIPLTQGGAAYESSIRGIDPSNQQPILSHWQGQLKRTGPIVFMTYPTYPINAIAPHSAQGASPASICLFDPLNPTAAPKIIFAEEGLKLFDMNLSCDGKTIFFSAKRKEDGPYWQIYEIGIDGNQLKKIVGGKSQNISPALLPDGRLIFVSDRASTYVQCQAQTSPLLYSCARDGSDIRKLSANIDSDHTPQVMNDGKILFTRWDYGIEKNVDNRQALWTMNPDGTAMKLFFGNTIEDPSGFWAARPVPGRPEVLCVLGPHHNNHTGMAGLVWNLKGPEAPRGEGFRYLTLQRPHNGDTGLPWLWQDLYPVNEKLYLASYGGDGGLKNRLYLLDDRGNRFCFYEVATNLGCFNPMPIAPRPVPPEIAQSCTPVPFVFEDPELLNQEPRTNCISTLMVYDVYLGVEPHIKRGEVKWIQVMEQVLKSRRMDGGEAWGHTPIIGRGTVHVRREIGRVPVNADGSAHFNVPALRNISMNLLNAEGQVIMRMGSDMHTMPGEKQSCIGCHENRKGGVPPSVTKQPLASSQAPITPQQANWGTKGILDYQRVVQPVWNKYCISCHSGPTPKAHIDLSGDRTRFFCMSYDNLVERALVEWHQPFANDYDDNFPKTIGAVVSKIQTKLLDADHCGKRIPPEMRYRVWCWIDANVPYYGTYDYTKVKDSKRQEIVRGAGARDSWQADGIWSKGAWSKHYPNTPNLIYDHIAPVFDKKCMSCHETKVYNGGTWGFGGGSMGAPFSVSSKIWQDRGLCAHMAIPRYGSSLIYGPELRINLTNPQNSSMLQAPLSKDAGGWGVCKQPDGKPVFVSTNDLDYQTLLKGIKAASERLYANPRKDMEQFLTR